MLRQMGRQFVIEKAVAIMGDEAVDVGRIGGGDAQRRLKMFARKCETMQAVMGGANDEEQGGRCALEEFFVSPGIAESAAGVIDVRQQGSAEMRIRAARARPAGTIRRGEKTIERTPQEDGVCAIAGGAGGRTDKNAGMFPGQIRAQPQSLQCGHGGPLALLTARTARRLCPTGQTLP